MELIWEQHGLILKDLISSIGHQGRSYEGFKPFSSHELMDFIGLMTLHSLCLSMRVEHEFKPKKKILLLAMICTLEFSLKTLKEH